MVEVLANPSLYEYTAGEAPSLHVLHVLHVLHARYAAQSRGCSPDGSQGWLNWVVILREAGQPVGFVPATVDREGGTFRGRHCLGDFSRVATPRDRVGSCPADVLANRESLTDSFGATA